MTDYVVKDIALADYGRKEIAIAETHANRFNVTLTLRKETV